MSPPPPQRETRYQVYFRTHRGGCGIEWDAAATEFRLVMHGLGVRETDPNRARMRLQFAAPRVVGSDLVARMRFLGYSLALVRADRLVGAGVGRSDRAERREGRWLVGRQRIGDDLIELTELWAADEAERLRRSPHRRPFRMAYDGAVSKRWGSRGERRLSPCDARFLVNLSRPHAGHVLLDPYAGIGAIVMAAQDWGLRVLCGDIDEALRPGLGDLAGGGTCIWDAADLPLPEGCADAVVTEPPYSIGRRADVGRALSELVRCLRPGARLVMLMDPPLYGQLLPVAARHGLTAEHDFPVRRQGYVARAVCWS